MFLDPKKMLDRLFTKPQSAKRPTHISPDQIILNLILLKSSSPSDSELRNLNITLNAVFI